MLLIAIVVIASSALYVYSVGLLGSLQKPAQQGSEILVIENIVFTGNACNVVQTDCSAYITVRNIGSIDSKISSIYVDNATKYGPNGAALVAVGQAQSFTLPNVTSTQHWFRVVSQNGSVFSIYGPQNLFIVGTYTTIITSGSITTTKTITTTSTYTTTTSTQTTLYSTQVQTTSTSTSQVTLSTTSTSLSTSTTPVTTYYTTTSTKYYMTTRYGRVTTTSTSYYSSATSTSISTSIITSQTTYAATTSAVTTSYFTTATGTTPTQTITSPVTTVVTTTVTTTTSNGIGSVLLFLFLSMAGFLGLREKRMLSLGLEEIIQRVLCAQHRHNSVFFNFSNVRETKREQS